MFPKNKINILYRLLCLISYIVTIIVINSNVTMFILLLFYFVLALSEKCFRDIELMVITLILLAICYLLNNYWLFKVVLAIDYCFYFLDTTYYVEEEVKVKVSKNDYVRFAKVKKKKKGSTNITAIYLTVHLGLLLLAIVIG